MEITKRRRANALFEDPELVLNEGYNSIVNNMTNLNINSNSQLLYQLNLKINDLEKKIDTFYLSRIEENEKIDKKMDKKIEELAKKIDDIFRDKEYTIDRLNEEIVYLKSKISEYENYPKSDRSNDYYM
jgi:hypothetical protein